MDWFDYNVALKAWNEWSNELPFQTAKKPVPFSEWLKTKMREIEQKPKE